MINITQGVTACRSFWATASPCACSYTYTEPLALISKCLCARFCFAFIKPQIVYNNPKPSNAHPAKPPLIFSSPFILDKDQPIAAPPNPNKTELHTWPQPHTSVHKTVLAGDHPLSFANAIKGT